MTSDRWFWEEVCGWGVDIIASLVCFLMYSQSHWQSCHNRNDVLQRKHTHCSLINLHGLFTASYTVWPDFNLIGCLIHWDCFVSITGWIKHEQHDSSPKVKPWRSQKWGSVSNFLSHFYHTYWQFMMTILLRYLWTVWQKQHLYYQSNKRGYKTSADWVDDSLTLVIKTSDVFMHLLLCSKLCFTGRRD